MVFGYFLMLIVMTYSVELFCAVCAGFTVGFGIFNIDIPPPLDGDATSCRLGDEPLPDAPETEVVEPAPVSRWSTLSVLKWGLWALPRLIIVTYFAVLFEWIETTQGGFGIKTESVFSYHALCMSLFVVLFTTEAVLVYSSPLIPMLKTSTRWWRKCVHVNTPAPPP